MPRFCNVPLGVVVCFVGVPLVAASSSTCSIRPQLTRTGPNIWSDFDQTSPRFEHLSPEFGRVGGQARPNSAKFDRFRPDLARTRPNSARVRPKIAWARPTWVRFRRNSARGGPTLSTSVELGPISTEFCPDQVLSSSTELGSICAIAHFRPTLGKLNQNSAESGKASAKSGGFRPKSAHIGLGVDALNRKSLVVFKCPNFQRRCISVLLVRMNKHQCRFGTDRQLVDRSIVLVAGVWR